MTIDFKSLVDVVAKRMAAVSDLNYEGEPPRDLFIFQLDEAASSLTTDAPASVLRPYGGNIPWVPTTTVSIQCMTTSPAINDSAGVDRSSVLMEALVDANGQPLRNLSLTGFKVLGFLNIGAPAQVGRDEKGRALWVFNFDVKCVPTA